MTSSVPYMGPLYLSKFYKANLSNPPYPTSPPLPFFIPSGNIFYNYYLLTFNLIFLLTSLKYPIKAFQIRNF